MLSEITQLLHRLVGERAILNFEYSQDLKKVRADRRHLEQVIMNLVVNARDAMPEGGALTIRLERIRLRAGEVMPLPELSAGEWVRIAVADTGTGIPNDVLPHIYEPFYTTKPPDQGTGLGLAQVFGIVALHKGALDVQTQVGKGTTFFIYLPALTLTGDTGVQGEADDIRLGHGETLLVIEDNPEVRATLVASLTQLNYRLLEARQGKEALALYERQQKDIALVISDWVMPEMGGRELVQALRARGLDKPVLILSGHPPDPQAGNLQEAGMVWLQKPLTLERLARGVAGALEKLLSQ